MPKKPSKLTLISVISVLIIAPLLIFLCMNFIKSKSYYAAAVMIIICAIVPFFAYFEKRKIKTGEIVIIALMTALSVASRSVMMFLPQAKPTCALVIVTAIAFGANVGFLTGSLSMLLSNFLFGQGLFTPFQMLGMGLTGFFCGLIFYSKKYAANRYTVSITGGILCFFVYGFIADTCSMLMLSTSYSLKSVAAFFASGFTFNATHAVTTAVLLLFINKPMNDKFSRLKTKYGIFEA